MLDSISKMFEVQAFSNCTHPKNQKYYLGECFAPHCELTKFSTFIQRVRRSAPHHLDLFAQLRCKMITMTSETLQNSPNYQKIQDS